MSGQHQRIAGYVATCSGVLAGTLAGAMIGRVFGEPFARTLYPNGGPETIFPTLAFIGLCMLAGAMLCCWLTLQSIRHPLAGRTTALLLVFLPLTALALLTARLQDAGSAQTIYLTLAITLGAAAAVSHYIALRFQRHL
jgi:hypothetical protein